MRLENRAMSTRIRATFYAVRAKVFENWAKVAHKFQAYVAQKGGQSLGFHTECVRNGSLVTEE